MKKVLLTLVALITYGFTNAQSRERGTIEITPKIGTSSFAELKKMNILITILE